MLHIMLHTKYGAYPTLNIVILGFNQERPKQTIRKQGD